MRVQIITKVIKEIVDNQNQRGFIHAYFLRSAVCM